jgi:hypothetical protein
MPHSSVQDFVVDDGGWLMSGGTSAVVGVRGQTGVAGVAGVGQLGVVSPFLCRGRISRANGNCP